MGSHPEEWRKIAVGLITFTNAWCRDHLSFFLYVVYLGIAFVYVVYLVIYDSG